VQLMASPGRGHQPPPWWAGPLQGVGSALTNLQRGLQQLGDAAQRPSGPGGAALPQRRLLPQAAASAPPLGVGGTLAPHAAGINADFEAGGVPTAATRSTRAAPHPVTKEELGRATWTFLHTLAAQYPEHPTRRQKRDAIALVDALTRIYPCAECAEHFAELVRCVAGRAHGPSFARPHPPILMCMHACKSDM
jgi:Erv1 / Alr family